MKRVILFVMLAICALVGISAASAQSTESYSYRPQYVAPTPIWNYPRFGYDNFGYHASTYEAGVLSGMGSLYRGAGEYNVANSIAAYNWQLARMANLQNNIAERSARAAVYASVRIGQERRHQENMKKNQALTAFHKKDAEARLAGSYVNRDTGAITWPVALQDAAFSAERDAAEIAVAQMTDAHQVAAVNPQQDLQKAVNSMRAKLMERKDEIRPSEYAYAKAFLDRLQNETQVDTKSLALSF